MKQSTRISALIEGLCYDLNGLDTQSNIPQLERFTGTLTQIAGLKSDVNSIDLRRELVAQGLQHKRTPLLTVVQALMHKGVQCKAASAVGSLCMSQEAGQALVKKYDMDLFQGLENMLQSSNYWAQGDAIFVLGWIAKLTSNYPQMAQLTGSILEVFSQHIPPASIDNSLGPVQIDDTLLDKKENIRIYTLVFLLNLVNQEPQAISCHLDSFWQEVNRLILLIVAQLKDPEHIKTFRQAELVQLIQLMPTLLHSILYQLPTATAMVFDRRLLPTFLHFRSILAAYTNQEEAEPDFAQAHQTLSEIVEFLMTERR